MKKHAIAIIGAGPAGIATALQLQRYDISFIIFEKEDIGGLLRNANLVENYPGFPRGITGRNLVNRFKKQLQNAKIPVNFEQVVNLEYENGFFVIQLTNQKILSNKVVLATGTKPKMFSNEILTNSVKDQIYYEIHQISHIKNKKIVIVGAGDAAFDYALYLSYHNKVIILNRSENRRCLPLLFRRSEQSENITYKTNVSIINIRVKVDKKLITCINTKNDCKFSLNADQVIGAIGRKPNLDYISKNVKNSIHNLQRERKLYVIGDAKNKIYRQVGISVGDGIKTAMKINHD